MLEVHVEGWRRAVGGRAPITSGGSREIINSSAGSGKTRKSVFSLIFDRVPIMFKFTPSDVKYEIKHVEAEMIL